MIATINFAFATLLTALALFAMAGALALIWHYKPKPPTYQKPKSYNREPESEYQNLINEKNMK